MRQLDRELRTRVPTGRPAALVGMQETRKKQSRYCRRRRYRDGRPPGTVAGARPKAGQPGAEMIAGGGGRAELDRIKATVAVDGGTLAAAEETVSGPSRGARRDRKDPTYGAPSGMLRMPTGRRTGAL